MQYVNEVGAPVEVRSLDSDPKWNSVAPSTLNFSQNDRHRFIEQYPQRFNSLHICLKWFYGDISNSFPGILLYDSKKRFKQFKQLEDTPKGLTNITRVGLEVLNRIDETTEQNILSKVINGRELLIQEYENKRKTYLEKKKNGETFDKCTLQSFQRSFEKPSTYLSMSHIVRNIKLFLKVKYNLR